MPERSPSADPSAGLVDLLDRVLGSGVVAAGDVVLSAANVDLVYLNLRALLASVQTIRDTDGNEGLERLGLVPAANEPELEPPSTVPPNGPSKRARGSGDEPVGNDHGWPGTRTGSAMPSRRASLDGIERFARRLDRGLAGLTRVDMDPK